MSADFDPEEDRIEAFLKKAAEDSVNSEPVRAQGKALELGICPSPQAVCSDCGFNLKKTCPTWWPPSRPLDRDFMA